MNRVLVVGGGLAGVEAAWALANRGVPVTIAEMTSMLARELITELIELHEKLKA